MKVIWSQEAVDSLESFPNNVAALILRKVEQHLIKNPEQIGKPLKSNLKGLYSYRIGDYRVIYRIDNRALQILVAKVAHRKSVYNI